MKKGPYNKLFWMLIGAFGGGILGIIAYQNGWLG